MILWKSGCPPLITRPVRSWEDWTVDRAWPPASGLEIATNIADQKILITTDAAWVTSGMNRPMQFVRRSLAAAALLAVLSLAAADPGLAQQAMPGAPDVAADGPIPPADIPGIPPVQSDPVAVPSDGGLPFPSSRSLPDAIAPYAPTDTPPDLGFGLSPPSAPELLLSAKLTEDGDPIRSGVVWRVFGAVAGPDGRLPLIADGTGGDVSFKLDPGIYLVHCGFGFSGSTVRVELTGGLLQEQVVLDAGGLKLQAFADDSELPSEDVRFDIYSLETDERGERKIVARDVKSGDLVRLTADTYHVVSRYGTVNAMTRADVEVQAGKLIEVSLYQRAAEVTLKLVGEPGGEAIADTKWSVLTPGGDIVTEGVGAFPSFILASGEYTVVAKHADNVYQRDFNVETGRNGEVEVLALR